MSVKPWCNWGKTYTQGWNMALSNGLHNTGGGARAINTPSGVAVMSARSAGKTGKDWRYDCCWKYNKRKCTKSGNECKYNHRCTYCAGWSHGYYNCRKRLGHGESSKGGTESGNHPRTSK